MRVPGNPRFERVREPGTDFDLNLPARTALACMSETMILALENRLEPYTLGRGIKLEKVVEIAGRWRRAVAFIRATCAPSTPRSHPEKIASHPRQKPPFNSFVAARSAVLSLRRVEGMKRKSFRSRLGRAAGSSRERNVFR